MAVQVSQDVYNYIESEAGRFQGQADAAEQQRDAAEASRVSQQAFADDAALILADIEVRP